MPSPDEMRPLIADIGNCQTLNQLIRTLLMYCRHHGNVYRDWNQQIANFTNSELWEQLAFEVAEKLDFNLYEEDTVNVRRFFFEQLPNAGVQEIPLVVQSRILAAAIEKKQRVIPLSEKLQESLAQRGVCVPIAPDELFPVIQPTRDRKKSWYGPSLSTNPESLIPPIDSLPSLGIAPSKGQPGPQIEIDLAHRAVSAPFLHERQLKFAVGVLNADSAELGELIPGLPPLERTFFGIGPVDADLQIARMRDIYRKAVAENVDVLVFPELCTNLEIATELMREFSLSPSSIAVFVAGSYHCSVERKNIAVGRTRDGRIDLRHEKLERYVHRITNLTEGIEQGTSVRVYQWKNWSASILICLDAISSRVLSTVSIARPHMVLVPAYTGRTSDFEGFAEYMVRNQSVIVMANGPIPTRGAIGVFAVPVIGTNDSNCIVPAQAPPNVAVPQLCIFEVATQAYRFV